MSQSPPDILSEEWAWENFRRDVFQLIAWGYQVMEPKIRSHHLEEDITGLIRAGIKLKQKQNSLDDGFWQRYGKYAAGSEDPVDYSGQHGKKRPRIDISIVNTGSRSHILYSLEAKRCLPTITRSHKVQEPIDWYAQGISSFLEGRYAQDAPEGGMLGLVQSDSKTYWKTKLQAKLGQDTALSCVSMPIDASLTDDLPEMSVSKHQRRDGTAITLYHAFLDCIPP